MPVAEERLRLARALIARVAGSHAMGIRLGEVQLWPEQVRAVHLVQAALASEGGCLLADDVGRGKTYVALAVARARRAPLVVAPAALRDSWLRAMERSGVRCTFVSHESFSRRRVPAARHDLVIVDESHRFRNGGTIRHAMLAATAAHSPVLLLSATPVQNRLDDLRAQLALFLGSSIDAASAHELMRHVVRSGEPAVDELPAVAEPEWLGMGFDDGDVLREIVRLPPPPLPLDAGDAGALRTISLVRAWASSRAALQATLRRRRRTLAALEQCALECRRPTRREVESWQVGDDGSLQLGLAPLLAPSASCAEAGADDTAGQLRAIEQESDALRRLEDALRAAADPDAARCEILRATRRRYAGRRIIAFSEFAATVRRYFSTLRSDPGVAMLTASDGRIASGRISRAELLARFAPAAQGAGIPHEREAITLLITTDLLSEGLDLQDASVVVHLDLPWNPARLAQRVGRVRRRGGSATVHSCLLAPPADAERLLEVERRLREKLSLASALGGSAVVVVPRLAQRSATEGVPDLPRASLGAATARETGTMHALLESWRCEPCSMIDAPGHLPPTDSPGGIAAMRRARSGAAVWAGALARESGWLAAFADGTVLARIGSAPPDVGPSSIRAILLAAGAACAIPAADARRVAMEIDAWRRSRTVSSLCGTDARTTRLQPLLARRMTSAIRAAPRHERATLYALAVTLREAMRRALPLGVERTLEEFLRHPANEGGSTCTAEWLDRALAILDGPEGAAARAERLDVRSDGSLLAVIVLRREEADVAGG